MAKRMLSILIVLVCILGMLPTTGFASIDVQAVGSIPDILLYERYPDATEFQISTPQGLQEFSRLGQSDTFAGKTLYMICDIDMNGFAYVPPVEFAGIFDGRFHAVKRLTVTTSDLNCGFIGKVTATGVVRNLGMEAGIFTATCSKDGWRAGSIAGIVEKGLIECCWSSSTVTISGDYASLSVGGIVGGLQLGAIAKNCYFAGIATGNKVAAGISGWCQGSSDNFVGQIYNCFNMGQLVAETKYAIGRYSGSITEGNKSKAMFNSYYFDRTYTEYDWSEGDIKASRHNLGSGYLARVLDTKSPLGGKPVWSQGALFPELRENAGVYYLSVTYVAKGKSSSATLYFNAGDTYTIGVPESVGVSLSANAGTVRGRSFVMPAKNASLTVTVDAANIADYSTYPNENLYVVTNAAGFTAMATAVNSGVTFQGKTFYMLGDINMEYALHTPIGKITANEDWSKSFSGSFYGNNFKVFNLKVNDTALNGGGLFGSSYQAYFNGLHIYNGSVTVGNRAGGISGYADACTFEYCTNGASIKSTTGTDGIGGLAGVARMSSVFNYCGNYGTVTATVKAAAGIAGWGQGNIRMTGCFNTGIITAPDDVAALARVKDGYTPAFKDCYYLKTACDVSVAGSATNLQRFRSGVVGSYINTSSRKNTSNGAFTNTPVIPAVCTQNQQPAICTRLYSYADGIRLDYQTICANLGDDLPQTNGEYYYGTEAYSAPDAITAYAYPTAVPFSISYETNGGIWMREGASIYTKAPGAGLPDDTMISKEGYAFAGWFENKTFAGQPMAVIDPDTVGDKTFYAKWATPVEIGSTEEYLVFVSAINSGDSYSDRYVRITADLDFGGQTIPAMGTKTAPFCGVLDGQGYTLKNFVITGDNAQGLVGYLKQGTVKFLKVENATVSGKTNTGSMVGINDCGLVMGCMSSADVVSAWTTYDYTLMCQNVRYSRAGDASPNSVEERIPRMKTFLKNYDPDIIGFQEYDSVWKTACESVLTGYAKQLVYGNTTISEAGTPLYWKSSKFSALEKGTFWLSETPEKMSYGWGAIHYRTCTYAVLKVKSNDMLIIVANAHLDHEVEQARDKGMELIMNRMNALVDKYEAKGYNEIYFHIIGDFNAQPTSKMAQELSKQLTEARYAAVTLGTPVDTNTYSAYKETPTSRGDFMFITNNVDVPYYKVCLDKINGYAISDHYGLYGQLRIGGNSHGGIAGENHGVILSCAYTGNITTGAGSSGIAAENYGRVLNSYSQYNSSAEGVFANAITTKYTNGRTDFSYYASGSGLAGSGATVADLKATDVPEKLNRMLELWVRRDGVNGNLPYICPKHEMIARDNTDGTHTVFCDYCKDSYVEDHVFTDGICVCGAKEIREPMVDDSLKINHTLNLASDISVNLVVNKMLLAGYDMDTVYVLSELALENGTKTVKLLPVEQGSYYYFTLSGLTAVNMNDRIRSVLYGTKDGQEYYSATDDYSIADYAFSQMDKVTIPDKLKVLCADLLRYGAKAQIYKNYRVEELADAKMTDIHKTFLSDMDAVVFGNTNTTLNDLPNASVKWAGKSLSLDSKVCLKFIFSPGTYAGELSELSLRVRYTDTKGVEKTVTISHAELYNADRNYYAFTLDTLLAAELRSVVSVQIYDGDTPVSCTLQYSADTYGNNKTGNLLEVCKALFAYSDSAKAYFIN
ncbi:MAG: InlB B-repeat-containing protein [Oscillospiraceae bacterium]|nr:InlB B-repeat-containing protein [Oscillospiraceae bacterium]